MYTKQKLRFVVGESGLAHDVKLITDDGRELFSELSENLGVVVSAVRINMVDGEMIQCTMAFMPRADACKIEIDLPAKLVEII